MGEVSQTNPSDNKQHVDQGQQRPDPRDRPDGAVGVDKVHGGGTDASDNDTIARGMGFRDVTQISGHNPNNPDSPNNPVSTAQRDLLAQDPRTVVMANQGPVTTYPTPTRGELDQLRREGGLDPQSEEGKKRLREIREETEKRQEEANKDREQKEREDADKRKQESEKDKGQRKDQRPGGDDGDKRPGADQSSGQQPSQQQPNQPAPPPPAANQAAQGNRPTA